jgi:hypothetical protein
LPGGIEENYEKLRPYSSGDLKPGHPDYKAGRDDQSHPIIIIIIIVVIAQ